MNLLETRLLDIEREKNDLSLQLSKSNANFDEVKKQNSLLLYQVENKDKEVLLLRGQIKMLTKNRSAQEIELSSLRGRVFFNYFSFYYNYCYILKID